MAKDLSGLPLRYNPNRYTAMAYPMVPPILIIEKLCPYLAAFLSAMVSVKGMIVVENIARSADARKKSFAMTAPGK